MENEKNDFFDISSSVLNFSTSHFNNLNNGIVSTKWQLDELKEIDELGVGTINALQEFEQRFYPGIINSNGGNYYGFVTGGSTVAAQMGDWLSTTFDQVVTHIEESSAVNIELEALQMIKTMLGLDTDFTGSFVTGATMANFSSLAQAREWAGLKLGKEFSEEGISDISRIKILASNPHSSIIKCLSMLGIGRKNWIEIPKVENREVIDVPALEQELSKYDKDPCIVITGAGYVNSGDFDNLKEIGKLKQDYHFWFHVDAAFGAYVALSDNLSHLTEGINLADSITIDNHKWLNVPYDSAIQLTRHQGIQLKVFKNAGAAYLGNDYENLNFVHLTPENSRRLRAIPTWFTLKAYGKSGYKQIVEKNLEHAKLLARLIEESKDFELVFPTYSNIVCFTLKDHHEVHLINQILHLLQKNGQGSFTPTSIDGRPAFRAAFCNWMTESEHVSRAWNNLLEATKDVLKT